MDVFLHIFWQLVRHGDPIDFNSELFHHEQCSVFLYIIYNVQNLFTRMYIILYLNLGFVVLNPMFPVTKCSISFYQCLFICLVIKTLLYLICKYIVLSILIWNL